MVEFDESGTMRRRRTCGCASGPPEIDSNYKALELRVLSCQRPHSRAFHCSWISFFVSFFVWFSVVPLLPYMQASLGLSNNDLWISNIFNLIPIERLVVGPLIDRYGPRRVFLALLSMAAVPTALTGLVNSAVGLWFLRMFIGIAGGTFVVCQYWSTAMFAPSIVGKANGFVGGWGNLGGGVTLLVMGSGLMPLFLKFMPVERAWRTVSLVPAALALITGVSVFFLSDDSPIPSKAHQRSTRRLIVDEGEQQKTDTIKDSIWFAARKPATWFLFIHYMMCFGVELTMLGAIGKYFTDVYGLTNEAASAVASVFGWMNLFARGSGGWASDISNSRFGLKGRIWTHAVFLVLEGLFVIVMAFVNTLPAALSVMVLFSIAVQATEGTTFAIVPYVDPAVGTVAGIVSSGGNIGGMIFNTFFIFMKYDDVFLTLGICILASVPLCLCMNIDPTSAIVAEDEEAGDTSAIGDESPATDLSSPLIA